MKKPKSNVGTEAVVVGTDDLLGLGLFVIESRGRRRDKTLGQWKPTAAFTLECNAEAYLNQYESIGYMRLRRPNTEAR